jgi:hypothetical protein
MLLSLHNIDIHCPGVLERMLGYERKGTPEARKPLLNRQ